MTVVHTRDGATATESDLAAEAARHVARYKLPKASVFVDATLGDPLADLCWALMFWATEPHELSVTASPPTLAPGFVTKAEFLERYGAASGIDLDDVPYFLAFSHWKLACLIQGSLYRRAGGQGGGLQASGGGADDDSGARRLRDLLDAAARFASDAGI